MAARSTIHQVSAPRSRRSYPPGQLPLACLIDEQMARQSLTLERLANQIRREAARDGEYSRASAPLVCKWRSGDVTPGRKHVRWLAMALKLPTEQVAAAAEAQRPAPTTGEAPPALMLLPPDSAGQDYIGAVQESIQQLVRLDNLVGGNDLAAVASRFFSSVERQMSDGRPRTGIKRDLALVAAELAEVAGWLLFDAGRFAAAGRMNQKACIHSRASGEHGIEVLTLQNMALQAQFLDHPNESKSIIDRLQNIKGQSPRVRSVAYMREAHALAQLGAEMAALTAFERARSLFLEGVAADDPHWAWWIDRAEIAFHEGECRAELKHFDMAIDLLQQAIDCVAANRSRDRFLYRTHLLDTFCQVREWDQAEQVLEELAAQLDEVGSARAITVLDRALSKLPRLPAVSSELRIAAQDVRGIIADVVAMQ